jgi:hypothetical protein
MEKDGFALGHEQRIANLRDEYKANVDLWIYESTFRQQRSEAFLNINAILLTALGILITIGPSLRNVSIVGILIAVFGLLTCTIWRQILQRNSAYMRFRRYQLRALEVQLQNVTTFGNQWKALNRFEPLTFPGLGETFEVGKTAKTSAIDIENRLPWLMGGLWLVILVAGIALATLTILGTL